jgi:hypothetical protein
LIGRHSYCSFPSSSGSMRTVSPSVGSTRLQRHAGLGVFVRREVGGRMPLFDGVGDGHVVGGPTVAVLDGQRVTRGFCIKRRRTVRTTCAAIRAAADTVGPDEPTSPACADRAVRGIRAHFRGRQ